MVGEVRNAHHDHAASVVTGVEGLAPGGLNANGVDGDVGAEAIGKLTHGLNNLLFREVLGADGVGGAELASGLKLLLVKVDGDDLCGPRQLCAGNGCGAHAAAAEDSHGLAQLDIAGVHGCTEARHNAAAEQASSSRVSVLYLGALTFVDQRLVCEGTNTQRRGEFGAILKGHLLGRVVGVEAVLRLALAARTALAADSAPVEDDEVTLLHVGHGGADALDHTGGLVAQQEREGILNVTIAVGQIRVANAAGLHLHHDVVLTGGRHDDVDGFHGSALGAGNHTTDGLRTLLRVVFIYVFINGHAPEATRTPQCPHLPPTRIAL